MGSVLESNTDVAIVGAGPSGLMAALWLTRCGVNVRIVDRRATKVFKGQADSLQPRTMEIFDSFGIADGIYSTAAHLLETRFWMPGEDGGITRVGITSDYYPELSRFHQVLINQGRTERVFLNAIKDTAGIEVERGVLPTKLEIDASEASNPEAYPVRLTVRHLTEEELADSPYSVPVPSPGEFNLNPGDELALTRSASGKEGMTEIINAKYILGSDGAGSWTRKQLGLQLQAEGQDVLWGTIDVLPITDFPDLRVRSLIVSKEGTLLTVPRENGIFRLAVPLDGLDQSLITPDAILEKAQRIMSPYKIGCRQYIWHAVYRSSQRLGTSFSKDRRAFLAGDAIHTHTPKAGIGMNFSVQDTYNLGWKLAQVVKGIAKPSILETYESERRGIAQQLIEFDMHYTSSLFSRLESSPEDLMKVFRDALPFTSCTSINYGGSMLVAKDGSDTTSKQHLAQKVTVGARFPSCQVINHLDSRPTQLQQLFLSDGKYRLVVFPGDISKPEPFRRLQAFGQALDAPDSFIRRFSPKAEEPEQLFSIITVHRARPDKVSIYGLHQVFHPSDLPNGQAYERVFADYLPYLGGPGSAYKDYGIDEDRGCVIAVRPDGYVMYIGELEDVEMLEKLFSNILLAKV